VRWYKKNGRAKSAGTQSVYRDHLRRLVEVVRDIPVTALSRDMVRGFVTTLTKLPRNPRRPLQAVAVPTLVRSASDHLGAFTISPNVVNAYLINVKAFAGWCHRTDLITMDIAEGIEGPAETRPEAETLSQQGICGIARPRDDRGIFTW
jgi:hypothetical protein